MAKKGEAPPPISVTRNPDGTFQFSGTSPNTTRDKNKVLDPYGYELKCYGVKLRLIPTKEQRAQINSTIGCARVVHNDFIVRKQEAYKQGHKLSREDYRTQCYPELVEERPYLKQVEQHAMMNSTKHAADAFKNFFAKKAGFPRFASRNRPSGNRYESDFPKDGIHVKEGIIYAYLPKIGDVKAILPGKEKLQDFLPQGADITGATVCREADRYYLSLHVSLPVPKPLPVRKIPASRICGVDMGLKSYAALAMDNGNVVETVDNPRWVKKQAAKIRRLQRSLSRKQKGSRNREKARLRLAKAHRKIANQRNDFQHKLSRNLTRRCDVFVCEDLAIKNMVKNHKLAREISSAGWGGFLEKVEYKLRWKGGIFLKVDRFFPSSKTCHKCGYVYENLSLREREWECPICHTVHDRDENAARNILREGIRLLESADIRVLSEAAS